MEVRLSSCTVDVPRRLAQWDDRLVVLTTKEAALLGYLIERAGTTVPRDEILRAVWGYRTTQTRTLEVTMRRLRQKVEADASTPRHLITAFGQGYRFEHADDLPGPAGGVAPADTAKLAVSGARDPDPVFVGRDQELTSIRARLEAGFVVTIVGPSGAGKTRLARKVALSDPGRVVWCDLTTVSDGVELGQLLARRLGTNPEHADLASMGAALVGDLLVVLDNADTVIPHVAALVRERQGARILVTSLEPLRVEGEATVRVTGLPAPEAVALFRRRFEVAGGADGSEDEAVLVDLVERVDRLPLGIELAAAHAASVGIRKLQERLHARPLELKSARRDGPARHRGLKDALQASWELLSEPERDTLRSLAVVPGAIPADLAERLVEAAGHDAGLLASLADKSLVVIEDVAGPAGDDTYVRLTTLVRAFVAESGPALPIVLPTLLAIAEQWAQAARRHDLLALERLSSIGPVVREQFLDHDDPGLCVRAVLVHDAVLSLRGPRLVRKSVLERGLVHALAVDGSLRARLLLSDGELLRWTGVTDEAEARFRQVLDEPEADGETRLLAWVGLAELSTQRAIGDDPFTLLARAEPLVADDPFLRGTWESNAAKIHQYGMAGDFERARVHLLKARTAYREARADFGEAEAVGMLGGLAALLGRFEEALALYAEAAQLYERGGYKEQQARVRANQGLLFTELGQYGEGEPLLRQSIDELASFGSAVMSDGIREMLGICLHAQGRHDEAEIEFGRAIAGAHAHHQKLNETSAMTNLATLLWRMGRVDEARATFDDVIARMASGAAEPAILVFASSTAAAFAATTHDQDQAEERLASARSALKNAPSAAAHWMVRIAAAAVTARGQRTRELDKELRALAEDPVRGTATDLRFLAELLSRAS